MRHIILSSILVGAAMLWPVAAAADDAAAQRAYDNGDYETAYAQWLPLAEAGDANAQFAVGHMHANGFGVAMDDAETLKWYRLAAAQGHAEAQFNMGVMYSNGWGVDLNDAEAARWFQMAADKAYLPAITNLARFYFSGIGVEKNYVESYVWYDVAKQLGDLEVQVKLDEIASRVSDQELMSAQGKANRLLAGFDSRSQESDQVTALAR